MENAGLLKGFGKWFMGPSLAALMTAAAPAWADGPGTEGKATIVDGADQTRTHPLPPETARQLKSIEEKLEALSAKPEENLFDKFLYVVGVIASFAAFYSIRQATQSSRETKKNNEEQKKILAEQKATLETLQALQRELNLSTDDIQNVTKKSESATRVIRDASYQLTQNLDEQKGIMMAKSTLAMLDKGVNVNRAERIGSFPDMYHYIIQRIQDAKRLVVITMPFYQFGVLGNPQGLHDFHHTLAERFSAVAGADGPRLVLVTYDDESRFEMARKRYSRAIHALASFDDTLQSKKLESIYREDVWKNLEGGLDSFRGLLNGYTGSREILANLGREQEKRFTDDEGRPVPHVIEMAKKYTESCKRPVTYKEAMDLMFLEQLQGDKNFLFNALHTARAAFSEAVLAQERLYFNRSEPCGTGTPWPEGATIVKVPRGALLPKLFAHDEVTTDDTFDNEMTVYIDGEIIHAASSLDPSDPSRGNRLVSKSGEKAINAYARKMTDLFTVAGQKQLLEEILKEIERNPPYVRQDWPGMPGSEV